MTVDFQEHFWGEKQNGFDILYQNLKCASASSKELAEFFRSKAILEEYNANCLSKLSRKTSNIPHLGTFHPLWEILKSSTDKLSSLHLQTSQRLNQLIKEISKYCDEHHKKQKQVKSEENPTVEAINELNNTLALLNKAKEFYFSKTTEIDRLRRENATPKEIEKVETRMNKACSEYKSLIEKYQKVKEDYEKKFRLSCQNFQKLEEEHLSQMKEYLANYSQILQSGHALVGQVYKEFSNNCNEESVEKLLEKFTTSKRTTNKRPADIQFEEANANFVQLNVPSVAVPSASTFATQSSTSSKSSGGSGNYTSSLDLINLEMMPQNISTANEFGSNFDSTFFPKSEASGGSERTKLELTKSDSNSAVVVSDTISNKSADRFDDGDRGSRKDSLSQCDSPPITNHHHKSFPDIRIISNFRTSKWFQRSKKDKSRDKQRGKHKAESEDDGSIGGSRPELNDATQPTTTTTNEDYFIDSEGFTVRTKTAVNKEGDNFYSSSEDSDSDDEKEKKIFVKINPLKNGTHSASVDQLIASATALPLAPSTQTHRRSNRSANPSPVLGNDGIIKRSDKLGVPSSSTTTITVEKKDDTASNSTSVFDPLTKSAETAKPASSDRYAAFSELFAVRAHNHVGSITEPKLLLSTQPPPATETNVLPLPPKTSQFEPPSTTFSTLPLANSGNSGNLAKSVSSTAIMGGNSFSVYKPLSKSFTPYSASNGMMSRTDSLSSLSSDFRCTPISFSSSRDSSPLTIGMSDIVPIAIAFQESVGACFKATEEQCKTSVIGCIKIAFSAGIIQVFSSNPYLPQLTFKLKNIARLDKIILSKELVTQVDSNEEYSVYEMNISALQSSLKRMYEQTPNARYFYLDIFKYQLRTGPGPQGAPLHLVSHWKCEPSCTNLKIDFKYNPHAFGNTTTLALRNVQFTANVDGNVSAMNAQPEGKWDSLTKQAIWKFNEISQSTASAGLGSIKAKFDLIEGPTCPSSVYVQFSAQDAILSGLDFELIGTGYRLSLIKRQFSSGRYFCEPKI